MSSFEAVPMYDDFSSDYDRFVDWEGRLASEMPFIQRQLQGVEAHRVLDTACGTGMHAIALVERGYEVVGTDLSASMIKQAGENAAQAGLGVRFEVAGFGELASTLTRPPSVPGRAWRFDAVLCLGNSLPHALTPGELAAALDDFRACLRAGGLLLIQNRNFDAVLADQERWMPPETHRESETEWLFLRFYDFDPDDLMTFNMVRLRRERGEDWTQQVTSTRLWPLTREELTQALRMAGFEGMACYGDLQGAPFDAASSPNLVVTACKSVGETG
jgi:SAM-dependent methyltransferase